MRNGWLYARPTWVPRIDAHGCSSLLGTPSAADAMGGHLSRGGNRSHELLLKGQVALLPTPGANDMTGGEGATREARQENGTGGPALRDIGHLLPTPTSMGSKASGGSTPDAVTLTDAVVRTRLGALTNPRFDDGNESPDLLPDQLTIGDA